MIDEEIVSFVESASIESLMYCVSDYFIFTRRNME